jgi:hypothetical protein
MSNFFPKFKDRKLYPAIQEALDNFMLCLDLQTIIEKVEEGLKETKLIGVRKGVCAFVDRFI